jgi:hypothetical protein
VTNAGCLGVTGRRDGRLPQVREALSFTGLKALAETVPVDWAKRAAKDEE